MTAGDACSSCGHPLGVGRFCVNCGHPVGRPAAPDWRGDTAERPAVRVPLPPPVAAPLPTPRPPGRLAWLPWAGAAAALVLVAAVGLVLVVGGGEEDPERAEDTPAAGRTTRSPSGPPEGSPSSPPPARVTRPQEVATTAEATVPVTAPPNQDVEGNLVRYEARNMLDGVPETCWRMPGDGTGTEVSIDLDTPTEIVEVGLVNGYAKTAQSSAGPLDWYAGNRRVLAVEWVFDDGTTVEQRLDETRAPQTSDVDPVVTSTVTLRILEVTPPGPGRSSRDYTAISDVTLVGTPV